MLDFLNKYSLGGFNYLTLGLKKQIKLNLYNYVDRCGWFITIGVVLRVLKIFEKKEKKLDKNKLFFLNYITKYNLKNYQLTSLNIKPLNLFVLAYLKKSNLLLKSKISLIIAHTSPKVNSYKKLRRIKRRLKKRLIQYEGL